MCGPINDYNNLEKFVGALCTDLVPRGNIDEYFYFPEETTTGYVIVNDGPHTPDIMEAEIEKITMEQQKWLQDYNITKHGVYSIRSDFYNTTISYGLVDLTNAINGTELHYFYIVDRL